MFTVISLARDAFFGVMFYAFPARRPSFPTRKGVPGVGEYSSRFQIKIVQFHSDGANVSQGEGWETGDRYSTVAHVNHLYLVEGRV